MQKELTKELYLQLHGEGKLDKEVMEQFNMNHNLFYKLKKEWGLTGTNHKSKNNKPAPIVEDTARKEELKKELEKVTSKPATIIPSETIVEKVTEKPCDCKASLEAKVLELQSRLALKDKQNQDLEQSILVLKKYKSLYFKTAETLKVHLP